MGLASALALALLLASCAPQDSQTVDIGVLLPLTGIRAEAGEHSRNGLEMAAAEINANRSKRYSVNLLYEDTQYKPALAVSGAQKLIAVDKVRYLIGPYGSSEVLAVAPIAERERAVLLAPSAQSAKISAAGDYIFRTQVTAAQEVEIFVPFLVQQLGKKRLDIISINNDYSKSYLETFPSLYKAQGGTLGLVQDYPTDESDFRIYLLKAEQDGAEAVLLLAPGGNAAMMVQDARELGMDVRFFATSPIESKELLEIGGGASEGIVYPYPFDEQSLDLAQHAYQERYVSRHGVRSEMVAANSYDALHLLSGCFEEVGTEVDAVKGCLYRTHGYRGASGTITFDENGDVSKPFIIKTVRNGTFVRLE